jgi:hypothetical protein
MSRRSASSFLIVAIGLMCWLTALPAVLAQHSSEGTVTVTVTDPSGSIVPGAHLELVDTSTSISRAADTQSSGAYTFVNLPLGTYRLTVSKEGFKKQVFASIVVQATKTTDIPATLSVGAATETVEVNATAAPLVESSSNAIGNVIDLKQIENLPIQGRDLTRMSQLVPGYTGTLDDGGGTWNGLPSIAQGNNIDGVVGSAGRMKFGGAAEPAVEPRVENIQEMTVQTDQLDLNQGYGTSTMQINFVTRRGSNAFHGRIFEDHQDQSLNANSWFNDAATSLNPSQPLQKNHFIRNEFGGSLGGPIIKDKLFFFGTFAMAKQPGTINAFAWVLTPAAQAGNFTYGGGTVNVLNLAGSQGLPSTPNASTTQIFDAVNTTAVPKGTLTSLGDPNFQQLNWLWPNPTTSYFPTVRVDFDPSQTWRFNVAWNMTKTSQPGGIPPNLPGSTFDSTAAGNHFKNYTAALGIDTTISPTLVNEFRGGFLYNASFFAYNGIGSSSSKAFSPGVQQVGWFVDLQNIGAVPFPQSTSMNGTSYQVPTGSYYPVFNASDTMTWQKKSHTLNFGFSWWREQNHYYNGVLGFPFVNMTIANGDPAANAISSGSVPGASGTDLTEARDLYAALVGRVGAVNGSYAYDSKSNSYIHGIGTYNLDELQKSFGLFAQDSFRIKPNLTVNYGLRWDFTWPDFDLTNAYHSAPPSAIWGPSGINNLFHPGVLNGTTNPQLVQNSAPAQPWFVTPQPAIGIAWNPRGAGNTVIRAGFSLRRFTEPQQYFWNQASDYGAVYFQSFAANANNTGAPGTFAPGSVSWQGCSTGNGECSGPNPLSYLPSGYFYAPTQYQKAYNFSDFTFQGGPGVNGVEGNIRQPYTESWNFGVQHQFGDSRALEIRYIGNRSLRQWISINPNEINIFENGFLTEFKAAQQNLAINNASGNANFAGSFANNGLAGQSALPIMSTAFAGEPTGPDGNLQDFTNGTFDFLLQTGQAGSFAGQLAGIGNADYLCNLVQAGSFAPCANIGYSGPGGPYPVNFFQANPFAQGIGESELVAKGYSNYNGLQVDFRQRAWHGLQFDANYTWSHTLGISTQNNWQGAITAFTLRNMRLSYGPTLFDIRHSVHISGTYDLPFGKGKQFLSNSALDRVVGGWTIGTIITLQSGNPFPLQGGYNTFNDYADGGVVLNGVTVSQLQSSVGVYRIAGQPAVDFINPKYLQNNGTGGGANTTFITPNTTPGTIGRIVWLHGPHFINDDMSLTKHIRLTERLNLSLQAEALNAFNHPSFQPGSGSGCSYFCYGMGVGIQNGNFGIGGTSPSYQPRVLELRGNIEF